MGKTITIDDIEPGAILDEDVMNPQGLVLLKKGVVIEEKHIKILRRWGVNKISIALTSEMAGDERSAEEIIEDETKNITHEMDERFSDCLGNEIMAQIKECVLSFRLKQLHKKYKE